MASKINSKKIIVDGISFDSKTEAKYYCRLKKLKENGKIRHIECHPKYELQPACERYGRKYRPMYYIADFLVIQDDGHKIVIDVKGYGMEDAALKRKLFAYKYPDLELRWIAASKKYSETGWIDYDDLQKIRRKARHARERGLSMT